MDYVAIAIGVVVLAAASVTDLRTREVPDLLSYGFLIFSVAYGIAKAYLAWSWLPLVEMLAGLAALGGIGLLMYYTGQWGGADTKLIAGVGALLGLWAGQFDAPLFVLILLVTGAFYGLLYTAYLAIANRKAFGKAFRKEVTRRKVVLLRRAVIIVVLVLLLGLIFMPRDLALPLLGLTVALYLFFYVWLFVRIVEQSILLKDYLVGELTEGDWIWKDVFVGKRRVCGPKDLGISNAQIADLKKHHVKSVMVKEGVPFVPSFLIAYILLWFVRDVIYALF